MDPNTDFIATELLSELKEGNARKDALISQLNKDRNRILYSCMIAILLIVFGFLLYLNQYDFTSTTSTITNTDTVNTAEGVYAVIDSSGNVIASDLTSEEIERILSTYGESSEEDEDDYNQDHYKVED